MHDNLYWKEITFIATKFREEDYAQHCANTYTSNNHPSSTVRMLWDKPATDNTGANVRTRYQHERGESRWFFNKSAKHREQKNRTNTSKEGKERHIFFHHVRIWFHLQVRAYLRRHIIN